MADELENDTFVAGLAQEVADLSDEINSISQQIAPLSASEDLKAIQNQAQSLARLKLEFENAGNVAFDIAKDPEKNLTNENYGLVLSLSKLDSFWEQRSDLDNAITGWFHSLKSKQQKNFEEFLFGKSHKWTIKEVYEKSFKSGLEDWQGISDAYYQEAVWIGYLVDKLNSDATKLQFSADESYFLPTQINSGRLKELMKQRQKKLEELEKARDRIKKYNHDYETYKAQLLAKAGITPFEVELIARNLAKRGLAPEDARHEIESYQVKGSNAVDSNLRGVNPDTKHSSAPAKGNDEKFRSKETSEILARMESARGTHKPLFSRAGGQFIGQIFGNVRNAQKMQAIQDSQARQDEILREELASRSSPPRQNSTFDEKTRFVGENNQSNAGNIARASQGQQIGASLGILGKVASFAKGFAEKKAIAAVFAAVPTGVTQALALAMLLKDRLAKLPLANTVANIWSWVKRAGLALGTYLIIRIGAIINQLGSILGGSGALGGTTSAAGAVPAFAIVSPSTTAGAGGLFGLGGTSTAAAGGGGASGFGGFMASGAAPPILACGTVAAAYCAVMITTPAAYIGEPERSEYYEAPKFTVSKEIVSVNGAPVTKNAIPNIGETTAEVVYKVTFTSQGEPISLSVPKDEPVRYKAKKDPFPIDLPEEGIDFPTNLAANESKSVNFAITLDGTSEKNFDDSRVVNTISVYGTVDKEEKPTGQTQTASVSLKIGNPKDGQPFGMPIAGSVKTLDYDIFEPGKGGCKSLPNYPPYTHCGEFLGMLMAGGLDIGGRGQVFSTVNGIVEQSSFDARTKGVKGVVVISTDSHEYKAIFMHLAKDGLPKVGDQITRGQPIGSVSTEYYGGAHVHYQIVRDGQNYPFASAPAGECSDGLAIMKKSTSEIVRNTRTLTQDDVATAECK